MRKWIVYFFLVLSIGLCPLNATEPDLLKASDISKIMKQILDEHLNNNDNSPVTSQLIQNSLLTYFDQFDPHRIYLMQSEVNPYMNLSEQQINDLAVQYKNENFSIYKQINQIIQASIERSRRLRQEIESKAKTSLFQVNPKVTKAKQVDPHTYARDTRELEERITRNLEEFISGQRRRFSDAIVAQRKDQTIKLYEQHLREFEGQYLFQDELGHPLIPAEQENLFTIHVLKALASSLDAHTSFYQPGEAYDMRVHLQKEFQGVGLILQDNPEGIKVTGMLPGSPAEKSGLIKAGDILVRVNGNVIANESYEKVMEKLHNSRDNELTLEFKRKEPNGPDEKIVAVKLKRTLIELKNDRVDISSENFGNGIIGVIKLHSFYQGDGISSEKDVRDAIVQLQKKGNLKGLVLDLRDNTGGFLSQAIKVAGIFIKNGIIVISKYTNGEEKIYRDVNSKIVYDGPLVILTSKLTASAAEIVAQALQDYGVGLIVGDERTYGKGTIQTQTVTDNQSSSYFKVTVGKYYTVSGKTPQKEGVKADIIVPSHLDKEQIGEEFVIGAVEGDKIPPMYNDTLQDIAPDIKEWYLKYYVPKLQQPIDVWRLMLPTLKKNSEHRIANNKNYQFYLKGKAATVEGEEEILPEEEEMDKLDTKKKNAGIDDIQLDEAENIVKDMVLLHTVQASENSNLEKKIEK